MRQYELDYYISTLNSDEIQHHGVQGQKWGVRRYQNPDGSLTAEGKKHAKKIGRGLAKTGIAIYEREGTPVLKRHEDRVRNKMEKVLKEHNEAVKAFNKLSSAEKQMAIKSLNKYDNRSKLVDRAITLGVFATTYALTPVGYVSFRSKSYYKNRNAYLNNEGTRKIKSVNLRTIGR